MISKRDNSLELAPNWKSW